MKNGTKSQSCVEDSKNKSVVVELYTVNQWARAKALEHQGLTNNSDADLKLEATRQATNILKRTNKALFDITRTTQHFEEKAMLYVAQSVDHYSLYYDWGINCLSECNENLLDCLYRIFVQPEPLAGSHKVPSTSKAWKRIPLQYRQELFNALKMKYCKYSNLSSVINLLEYKLIYPEKYDIVLELYTIYYVLIDIKKIKYRDDKKYRTAMNKLNLSVTHFQNLYCEFFPEPETTFEDTKKIEVCELNKWAKEKIFAQKGLNDISDNFLKQEASRQITSMRRRAINALINITHTSCYFDRQVRNYIAYLPDHYTLSTKEDKLYFSERDQKLLDCIYMIFLQGNPLALKHKVPTQSSGWQCIPYKYRKDLMDVLFERYGNCSNLTIILKLLRNKLLRPKIYDIILKLHLIYYYSNDINKLDHFAKKEYRLAINCLNSAKEHLHQLYESAMLDADLRFMKTTQYIEAEKLVTDELTEKLHNYEARLSNVQYKKGSNAYLYNFLCDEIKNIKLIMHNPDKLYHKVLLKTFEMDIAQSNDKSNHDNTAKDD